MMKLSKTRTGQIGEELALKFLLKKGYKLIEKNFRCSLGEIDLIVSDSDKNLIFVEVRSKTDTLFGEPFETVGIKKQRRIYRLAEYYLNHKDIEEAPCRFDVISLLLDSSGKLQKLEHIEKAFGI